MGVVRAEHTSQLSLLEQQPQEQKPQHTLGTLRRANSVTNRDCPCFREGQRIGCLSSGPLRYKRLREQLRTVAPTRGPRGRTLRQESHEAVTWRRPPHGRLEGERDSQREGGQLGRPGPKAVEKIRVGQRRGYQHGARERQGSAEK